MSKATQRLTMAQAMLRFLDNQYISVDGTEQKFVRGVMGIFGHGNVTGIGEAMERSPGELTFIQGKNEQGMVHAATAFAKQNNRRQIFACTSSIGPGALNMVTAAATATVNRIPVLLLPGDIFANRQPDPVLQQIEHPLDFTISANDAFKPVSRFWDRIQRPEQLIASAVQAMRVLTDPAETGAVTLALPQDVQTEAFDYPAWFFEKRVHYVERRMPAPDAVARAAAAIALSKRPLIVAGGGVHYAGATKALEAFATALGIPVTETQAGKSALPWNHPLNMGAIGVTGSSAANRLAHEADLVIGIGTRYSDFTTASKSAFSKPGVRFVNVNINASDASKLNALTVVADAGAGIAALHEALAKQGYRSGYAAHEARDLKTAWDKEVDRLYGLELPGGLSQTRALGVINTESQSSDVIVCAAGSLPGDLHRLWRSSEPKTYHMEYGFSCMGYEVAGAFGAALAEPGREVFAIVGDGSYMMMHSELLTSLQEGRKITVLLLDNHGFQCIHNLQRAHGSDGFGNEFRFREGKGLTGTFMPIDFAAYAASLGAKSYKAHDAASLAGALRDARKERVSTLVDIKVLPGTNTGDYESWWRVDVPEVSASEKVRQARIRMQDNLKSAGIL